MKQILTAMLILCLVLGLTPVYADDLMYDDGMTYATGLPITKEVVTIDVLMNPSSIRPDMDKTQVLDWLEEKTNIRFNVKYVSSTEEVALLFASGDLPDMTMGIGPTTSQMSDAIDAGWIVNLDEYMEFMPSVKAFFERNPFGYAVSKTQGSLYSLPYMDIGPFIRDSLCINTTWLKEAGVERVPTTIDEFTDAMRAVRAASGKGNIPEDCHPIYFKYANGIAYGELDLIGQWGLPITSADYCCVYDGKVVNQALNPQIKEPLKWLQQMYLEGLIMPEVFTDDWSTAISRMQAVPSAVGYYNGAMVYNAADFEIMPALKGGHVRPAIRSGNPKYASILYANCPYPVAIARLYEYITSDIEAHLTISKGMEDVIWHYSEADDLYHEDIAETEIEAYAAASQKVGLVNTWFSLRDNDSWYSKIYNTALDRYGSSEWAMANIYGPSGQVLDDSHTYYGAELSGDDLERWNDLSTEIDNLRKTTFARWISTNADIEAEWDEYVQNMQDIGCEEWLSLKQRAYDMLME